jgi:hypothetical protein
MGRRYLKGVSRVVVTTPLQRTLDELPHADPNKIRNKVKSGRFYLSTPDVRMDPALASVKQLEKNGSPLDANSKQALPNIKHFQSLLHQNLMASKGKNLKGRSKVSGSMPKRPYYHKAVKKGMTPARSLSSVKKGGMTFVKLQNLTVQPNAHI